MSHLILDFFFKYVSGNNTFPSFLSSPERSADVSKWWDDSVRVISWCTLLQNPTLMTWTPTFLRSSRGPGHDNWKERHLNFHRFVIEIYIRRCLLRIHTVLTIILVSSVHRNPTNKPEVDPDSEGENIVLHWDPAVNPGQRFGPVRFHLKQLKSHSQTCQMLHLKRLWRVGVFSFSKTRRETMFSSWSDIIMTTILPRCPERF